MEMAAILIPILDKTFSWNYSRISFLAYFLLALLKVKTVNLAEISMAFGTEAKIPSSYKRIQRFFRFFPIDFACIAKTIAKTLSIANLPWALTLDRTNWKFGKLNINILVLAIAYKGIAFPVLWILLPKRGNSNTKERIALLNRFISIFSLEKIQCLLADREFLGKDWFFYLVQNSIFFAFEFVKICISQTLEVSLLKQKIYSAIFL